MTICVNCHEDRSDVAFRSGLMVCEPCMRARYARALGDYVTAQSDEVVETPFGWCTARCVWREPVRWLCAHIHANEAAARACLTETIASGGGSLTR